MSSGLIFGRPLSLSSNYTLFEGRYPATNLPILIHQHTFHTFSLLSRFLSTFFSLSRLPPLHSSHVLHFDLKLINSEFVVTFACEKPEKTLEMDIKERKETGKRYSEGEIWSVVRGMTEVLVAAQGLVRLI